MNDGGAVMPPDPAGARAARVRRTPRRQRDLPSASVRPVDGRDNPIRPRRQDRTIAPSRRTSLSRPDRDRDEDFDRRQARRERRQLIVRPNLPGCANDDHAAGARDELDDIGRRPALGTNAFPTARYRSNASPISRA